jgi:hypothetical protein
VLWGMDVRNEFDPLFDAVDDLRSAIILFIRYSMPDRKVPAEKQEAVEKTIYEANDGTENDDFALKIVNAVEKIRTFCKTKL